MLDTIKNNNPLLQVVQHSGVALKQTTSSRFVGICPFHGEKTPSFMVYINDNKYHCFGCGAHGDVIDFVMEFYGCSFKDAMVKLGYKEPETRKDRIKLKRYQKIADHRKKRTEKRKIVDKKFGRWVGMRVAYLTTSIEHTRDIMKNAVCFEEVERISGALHRLAQWEHERDWLLYNDKDIHYDFYRGFLNAR